MVILGFSGLDRSVDFARRSADLRPGEDRMVQGLDSAAALLVDGKLVAAAAEERFSGEKHSNRFPRLAIRYCLEAAGIEARQVDRLVHGFNYGRYASLFKHINPALFSEVLAPSVQLEPVRKHLSPDWPAEKFLPVDHHLAHAASAYYPSGFGECLCVVCDGMGETAALTVYHVRDGAFKALQTIPVRDSIGILYSVVTRHLGFKFNSDEYKVMGLAPYGDRERFRPFFRSLVRPGPEGKYRIDWESLHPQPFGAPYYRNILEALGKIVPGAEDGEAPEPLHRDFAAGAQECLEETLFHVLDHWRSRVPMRKLCYAGGVALNCTFNGRLIDRGWFDEIYVQPASGDDGTALGAALAAAGEAGEIRAYPEREMPYYGPEFSRKQCLAAAERFGDRLEITDLGSPEAAADDAARGLHEDRIIAWFQGRMEYGPRALGHRSILANPTPADIKERLNRIIKLREGFRPFAPAVLKERAESYFEIRSGAAPYLYMLGTCPVRPAWRERLPGITHVDGSARVQVLEREKSPLFYGLVEEFERLSGVGCVVNTSFNVRGQPMILSPETAVETFLKVRIDRLYLGTLRLTKRGGEHAGT